MVDSSAATSTSAITTRIPSARNRSTSPRPIPLAPPVTTATFPSRSCILLPLSRGRSLSRTR